MANFMNNNPNATFVESNTDGFARANNSDYAFIAESTTIDYQVQRMCKLKQIGGLLDSKGYGLAFPKGISYFIFSTYLVILVKQISSSNPY
jgi:hypothetical protein